MNDNYDFLKELNEKQKNICESPHNFILTACPGSGKTRTITYRLAYMAEKYKKSKKINIAITYTNRAANEIENRIMAMGVNVSNIWTGTIHQFCMKYIIRPYAMYHEQLSKGYRIIDEYVKDEYLKEIAGELGIKKFYVKDLYKNDIVMKTYLLKMLDNREIDFDMILQYSQELLEHNIFIAQNISDIVCSIHVDEYQDTNERQYLILALIVKQNKNINILFVGDVNQAIYRNLGGVAKSADEIKTLFPVNFLEKCLDGCYRSTQRIVDYYVNYEVAETGAYSASKCKNTIGKIKLNTNIDKDQLLTEIISILKTELKNGTPEEEICIVAPQWYQIYPMANELRKQFPENHFDAPDISPVKYDPLNIFFLICKLLFTKQSEHRLLRRKEADDILNMVKEDYGFNILGRFSKLDILKAINSTKYICNDGLATLENAIEKVLVTVKIEPDDKFSKAKQQFFDKVNHRIKEYKLPYDCHAMESCFKEKKGIVISTIHGVKGEEYKTVIGYDLLNGHLPHWDYIYNDALKKIRHEETKKMLYVLCSRAKENLYLFAEKGRTTQKGYPLSCTDELSACAFKYD
ncbi:MAG: ATP-dependent helicase [Clostridiales bacterium]|nr:ATP-dependent helicase [Clostridiales bacterium]